MSKDQEQDKGGTMRVYFVGDTGPDRYREYKNINTVIVDRDENLKLLRGGSLVTVFANGVWRFAEEVDKPHDKGSGLPSVTNDTGEPEHILRRDGKAQR